MGVGAEMFLNGDSMVMTGHRPMAICKTVSIFSLIFSFTQFDIGRLRARRCHSAN